MTGGYWMAWLDAGDIVWHQVFHVGHLCYWWSMAAGGFVIGACP